MKLYEMPDDSHTLHNMEMGPWRYQYAFNFWNTRVSMSIEAYVKEDFHEV